MRQIHGIPLLAHLLAFFITPIASQDPDAFCSRLYHSSIIIDETLYVDAGELRERNSSNGVAINLINTLDTLDLSKPWGNGDDKLWKHISKNITSSSFAPSLNDGAIFSNESRIYLFGGAVPSNPGPHPAPPPNSVWQYDIDADEWSKASPKGDSVQRVIIGTNVQSSKSQAYYLGGSIVPKSDAAFLAIPFAQPYLIQGLLEFDVSAVQFTNVSTTGLDSEGTVAAGFLALIESYGDEGILISFGGFKNTPGVAMDIGSDNLRNSIFHRVMDTISIFDIANKKWYSQSATGDIPPWRYNGCSIVVGAPDKSSYSIYVFGGWGGTSDDSDGNVYVLSIPSFRWIRVTSDSEQRQRHQCHVLGGHTMLVVGGIQPNNDIMQPGDVSGCDSPSTFSQGLGIFSLADHSWKTNYDPRDGASAYKIHSSIFNIIGGNANGGAVTKEPSGGFSDQTLGSLLSTTNNPNPTSPGAGTSPSSSSPATSSKSDSGKKLSGGAIAGIVIGAVVLLCCLVGVGIFMLSQRKGRPENRNPSSPTSAPLGPTSEMNAASRPIELTEQRTDKELPYKSDVYRDEPQELMSRQTEQNRLLSPQEMEAPGQMDMRGSQRNFRSY